VVSGTTVLVGGFIPRLEGRAPQSWELGLPLLGLPVTAVLLAAAWGAAPVRG